jgi:hypothetical protein
LTVGLDVGNLLRGSEKLLGEKVGVFLILKRDTRDLGFIYLFGSTVDRTQGLGLARQAFYHLCHIPVLLFLVFQMVSGAFAQASLRQRSSRLCLPSSWNYRHELSCWASSHLDFYVKSSNFLNIGN